MVSNAGLISLGAELSRLSNALASDVHACLITAMSMVAPVFTGGIKPKWARWDAAAAICVQKEALPGTETEDDVPAGGAGDADGAATVDDVVVDDEELPQALSATLPATTSSAPATNGLPCTEPTPLPWTETYASPALPRSAGDRPRLSGHSIGLQRGTFGSFEAPVPP